MYHFGTDMSSLDVTPNMDQFLYDQGIQTPFNVNDSSIITTIVLFNAALLQHLLARKNGNVAILQKTRNLYKLAYESCNMNKNVLFPFVVVNNIAVILQDTPNNVVV